MAGDRVDEDTCPGAAGEGDASHDLRSYGRRRGRRPSDRQSRLLSSLLPQVRLGLDVLARVGAHACFYPSESPREIWLEIGFGGGEHLVAQAERNRHVGLVGCEPFEDGVVKVLTAIEERALANIRLWPDDAREVLRCLPAASITRAFVLFPDPWPKRRHQKRRLLSAATLGLLARALRPGGELRVATDIPDYARTIFMALAQVPELRWTARGPDDWRQRPLDWVETRYEQKALREGRQPIYLRLERVPEPECLRSRS